MSYMNHVKGPKNDIFIPKFPDKYAGKDYPISRSSWEKKFMEWCDVNNNIIKWASEPLAIQYYDPIKKKNRRYYPDLLLKIINKEGKEVTNLVEIKPYKETIPPIDKKGKKEKTLINEVATYATNTAKWKAAQLYCKKRGIVFKILTEKDLFR